ncbi:sigma-70 family RNA polymerase sigma factor [Nonomuraea sp. NPDC049784]|uniref:sigma-70 family RNA polymerase sigma factor n=1 Tax=Nonomuraea sp. NPDC049784 TaxID=3154361 RepID=UPI003406D850
MNDRVLVEALRARDPGALSALYDTYAESIYCYCWSLLRSADSAQVALRDTLIAAEAHAGALADPDLLRAWLYALARAECLRRRAAAPPGAAEALAEAPPLDDPADADLRIMAWNAVQSLPVADREVLELAYRHSLPASEMALVLGTRQLEPLLEEARERLHDAITAEVLARKGPYDCPRRAAMLAGFSGELTQEMRERLVRHLPRCEICAPHRHREVSAAKVFELLPAEALPDSLRVRVMSCFIDPELLPYRRYVARRTAALGAAGFPVSAENAAQRWPKAVAGALAAVATVVAIVVIFQQLGGGSGGGVSGVATAAFPATGQPPGIQLPWHSESGKVPVTGEPVLDSRSTQPIVVTGAPMLVPSVIPAHDAARSTSARGAPSFSGPPQPNEEPPASHVPPPTYVTPPTHSPPTGAPPPEHSPPSTPRTRTPCPTPTRTPTETQPPPTTPTATPTATTPTQTATPTEAPSPTVSG